MAANAEGAPVAQINVIRCVECDLLSVLPPKGVQGLPIDRDLVRQVILVLRTNNSGEGLLLCTLCSDGREVVAKCHHCACNICSECVVAHKYMYYFQSHQVIITVIII